MPRTSGNRRGAAVTLWALLVLTFTLLALGGVALNQARLWTIRAELQASADAAAHAATAALVGDDLLRGAPAALPALLQNATAVAGSYGALNPILGEPLLFQPNPDNDQHGDIVFATVATPRSRDLVVAQQIQDVANVALAQINLVQVTARLLTSRGTAPQRLGLPGLLAGPADVLAQAAATLDRDVIGFRPLFAGQNLPLAPLAVLSDPTDTDPLSWQYLIEAGNGPDQFSFDATTQAFTAGSDALPEFAATLALTDSPSAQANVVLLLVGVSDAAGAAQQLIAGVSADQLQALGGQLVLDASDNRLMVAGSAQGPAVGTPELTALYQALEQVRQSGQHRLWPLYCAIDSTSGNPILCGFVAARIVSVTAPAAGQPLAFALQPTMVAHATALTDATRRGVGGIAIVNPYICKVRLVE